jgi:CheY-like chemotaxis protein
VMGGDLTVDSAVGKGTVFRVKLMMSEVTAPRAAVPIERPIRGYSGKRRTVVVVDDDPDHRQLVHEVLAPLGFTVFSAPDGPTSLTLIEQCEPDLVLLDLFMPGMSGWEVARRIRAARAGRTRIVMLSANANDTKPDDDEARLYDVYLMKPVIIQQLLDSMKALLALEWTYEDRALSGAAAQP